MRVALLSCGPSVVEYDGDAERYDAVIGVNRIVGKYECDYWVFGDPETFVNTEPLGRPTLVTDAAASFTLTAKCGPEFEKYPRIGWESLPNPLPLDTQVSFSAVAALLLVKHLGAESLSVYGVDMAGDAEWDGRTTPERGEDRWQRERRRWEFLVNWLAGGETRVL